MCIELPDPYEEVITVKPEREAPGFHRVDERLPCMDPSHGFPTHLYVPPGMKYVHYCPSCGQKAVVYSPTVWC